VNPQPRRKTPDLGLNPLILSLRKTLGDMEAFTLFLQAQPMEVHLRNLQSTAGTIGAGFPRHPVEHPRYVRQWAEFLAKKRKDIDNATARYLCWEPTVATDGRFLAYLADSCPRLTRRPLAGLVRSIHLRWKSMPSIDVLGPARTLVSRYEGESPVILKWKSVIDHVLGPRGPETCGSLLVEEGRTLASLLEEWYLDPCSPFVDKTVEAASVACRDRLAAPTRALIELLFGELLPWPGWEPSHLRREVAELVLQASMTGQVREILQRFVMMSNHLGDPRLASNQAKWADTPRKARERVLLWLSQNPFQLLEQVYQEGKGWIVRRWGEGNDEPSHTAESERS
jgi:hypothetical protein